MHKCPDPKRTENRRRMPGEESYITEASPNPHNEVNIPETPVRTDQQDSTGSQNVAGTPSTRDGRIHPSVGESVGGGVADTDSMFNQADPQAGEMGPSGTRTQIRGKGEERHPTKRKAA